MLHGSPPELPHGSLTRARHPTLYPNLDLTHPGFGSFTGRFTSRLLPRKAYLYAIRENRAPDDDCCATRFPCVSVIEISVLLKEAEI